MLIPRHLYLIFAAVFLSCELMAQINPEKYITPDAINKQADTPAPKVESNYRQMIEHATQTDIYAAIEAYNKEKFMKSPEFMLSGMLLIFAIVMCCLNMYLFLKGKLNPFLITRLTLITLIIFSVLFLITAGYSNDQIAPAVGLLGTIAGYLLGRNSPPSETPPVKPTE